MPEMGTTEMMMPQELEARCQSAFNTQNYAMDTSGALYPAFYFGQSGKWSHAEMAYACGQVPAPLQIPYHHPGWITGPHPQVDPGMITEGSSSKSSPISPDTPEPDISYGVQNPYSADSQGGSISPYYTESHGAGVYAGDGQGFHGTQRYSSFPAVSLPEDGSPVEMPASSPIITSYSHPARIPSRLNEPYQEMSQEMIISQPSIANPRSPYHASEDPRIGTFEFEDSKWCRQPKHMGRVEDYSLQDQQVLNQPQQAVGHVDNDRPQSLSQEGSTTATQAKSYSPATCEQCGTQFNGRYSKGNLKRHFNRFHNLFKSMAGMTCRQCRKEFKRGDAARKHERTVHGYVDVMTTPRRRGKAPAAMY